MILFVVYKDSRPRCSKLVPFLCSAVDNCLRLPQTEWREKKKMSHVLIYGHIVSVSRHSAELQAWVSPSEEIK